MWTLFRPLNTLLLSSGRGLSQPLGNLEELSLLTLSRFESDFDQHCQTLLYQDTIANRSPSVTGVTS